MNDNGGDARRVAGASQMNATLSAWESIEIKSGSVKPFAYMMDAIVQILAVYPNAYYKKIDSRYFVWESEASYDADDTMSKAIFHVYYRG